MMGLGGLLLLCAALQLLLPASVSVPPLSVGAGNQGGATPPAVGASALPPRDSFAEIEQRPLFISGRRPAAATPTAQVQAAQPGVLVNYAILGIIAAPDRAQAVLQGSGGAILHLRAGQTLEGWTLEKIQPRKLVFGAAGQHQEVELRTGRSQPGQNPNRTNNGVTVR